MAHVRDELALQPASLLELHVRRAELGDERGVLAVARREGAGHRLERALELSDLVWRACRYRRVEVALLDPARGAGEVDERRGQRARGAIRKEDRCRRERDSAGQHRRRELALGLLERREWKERDQDLGLRRRRPHQAEDRGVALATDSDVLRYGAERERHRTRVRKLRRVEARDRDRKSTRLNSSHIT